MKEDKSLHKRLSELTETVMKVARGDYTVQNELSGRNDELDALAMGMNMMIDDLRNNADLESRNKEFEAINAELMKAKKKAQESDRLKSAFLSNMSHEIRTPLNAIMGFSALLSMDHSDPEKTGKYLSYIENSGKQLMAIIDDILDISQIDAAQLSIQKDYYNLIQLLDQVIEIIQQDKHYTSNPDLNLVCRYKEHKDICHIYTDQVRFKQILLNLLTNALKFTDVGYIEVGISEMVKHGECFVEIYIRDSGVGIPYDLQDSIFDRFRQVHDNRFQEGTGLGLSICKGLVDILKGEIRVESTPGKGSVFYVGFPGIREMEFQKIRSGRKALPLELSGFLIYIAEDDDLSFYFLEAILSSYGPEIIRAQNGRQLIDLIEKQVPDLVLLDIKMPVMNGREVIKEIRERNYTFPVIAQTSYALSNERTDIINLGCDGYISKPIDPNEIIEQLARHLTKKD